MTPTEYRPFQDENGGVVFTRPFTDERPKVVIAPVVAPVALVTKPTRRPPRPSVASVIFLTVWAIARRFSKEK